MKPKVLIGGGRIVVPRETYDLYLAASSSAALIERDSRVYLLPLSGPVAGGLLLKQRNLHGDRVMLAPDFLAAYGVGEFAVEREFAVRWVADAGALWIEGLGRPQV